MKIKVGVIPAAGKGSRIGNLPLTRVLPKPMLPVLNKPIIEYVVNHMRNAGVETIHIIVGHKKEVIRDYFGNGQDFGVTIDYLEQKQLNGIANAIYLAKDYVSESFITILGDDFSVVDSLESLLTTFYKRHAIVAEYAIAEPNLEVLRQTNSMVIDQDGLIKDIIEKPTATAVSLLRGAGIYAFRPEIFEFIEKTPISCVRGEKEITDTIKSVSKSKLAYGVPFNGVNVNINTLNDLLFATKYLLTNKSTSKDQLIVTC